MTIYEDEIDLRPYIEVLIKNWWKIAVIALFLAVIDTIF